MALSGNETTKKANATSRRRRCRCCDSMNELLRFRPAGRIRDRHGANVDEERRRKLGGRSKILWFRDESGRARGRLGWGADEVGGRARGRSLDGVIPWRDEVERGD